MMKILLVLENYYPNVGGLETLFKSLAESLSQEGHQITIITNKNSASLPFKERLPNITILRYPFQNRYIFTLLAFFPVWFHARKNDLIHTTSYNAGLPSFFAGFFAGKKVFITFHEVWGKLWFKLPFFNDFSLRLHYLFEQFLLKLPFYKFIAVSDFTQDRIVSSGIDKERVVRIYNGISYRKFDKMRSLEDQQINNDFVFLYFGRLGISKGLDVFFKAIKKLAENETRFKVTLIIPRQPRKLFRKVLGLINDFQISPYITLLHELEEQVLFKTVQSADCIVIPSYSEGFCFTAAESVALGRPIISSHQGALPEVVSGKHLVFQNQDPDDLYHVMIKAIEGEWKFSEVRKFELEDTVNNYIHLYQSVIKKLS